MRPPESLDLPMGFVDAKGTGTSNCQLVSRDTLEGRRSAKRVAKQSVCPFRVAQLSTDLLQVHRDNSNVYPLLLAPAYGTKCLGNN
jgi:hypothetical protein